MGERTGNVSLGDVAMRLIEIAKAEKEPSVANSIGRTALFKSRVMPAEIVAGFGNFYSASQSLAQIYGVEHRFERTAFGDPEAYNAGCGPHDQASVRALEDPVRWPLYKTYIPRILTDAILGRPQAEELIKADPAAVRAITVNGHAAGGSTRKIEDEDVELASQARRSEAEKIALREIEKILDECSATSVARSVSTFSSEAISV